MFVFIFFLFVCLLFYFIYFYFLCVHFIFEKFQKDKKYSNLFFFSSFFCLMHLECPLYAHASSMDLFLSVLKCF
jgi:uncharacterized membrane protein YdjX (TVP38/TMEM64 family)